MAGLAGATAQRGQGAQPGACAPARQNVTEGKALNPGLAPRPARTSQRARRSTRGLRSGPPERHRGQGAQPGACAPARRNVTTGFSGGRPIVAQRAIFDHNVTNEPVSATSDCYVVAERLAKTGGVPLGRAHQRRPYESHCGRAHQRRQEECRWAERTSEDRRSAAGPSAPAKTVRVPLWPSAPAKTGRVPLWPSAPATTVRVPPAVAEINLTKRAGSAFRLRRTK
jgi:hypothetical protein